MSFSIYNNCRTLLTKTWNLSRLSEGRVLSVYYSVKSDYNTTNSDKDELLIDRSGAYVKTNNFNPEIAAQTSISIISQSDALASNTTSLSPNMGRDMPLSQLQLAKQLLKTPNQPENARSLKVSIIGAPNAGKSTLTNMLLGWRVSSTSSKVHTTRARINAVLTENETQVVFLDTPGMTTPKKRKQHHLERSLLTDPHSSFSSADLIAVVVDVSKPWFRQALDKEVLKALLLHRDKPSVLILNKIDELKSRDSLLTTTRILTEGKVAGKLGNSKVIRENVVVRSKANILKTILKKEGTDGISNSSNDSETSTVIDNAVDDFEDKQKFHHYYGELRKLNRVVDTQIGYNGFQEVFMVSSTNGEGVADLRTYFMNEAETGDWEYHSDVLTDIDPHQVAQDCVLEKLMEHLPHEVPYNIDINLVLWKVDQYGVLRIAMDLICYNQRHMKLLLGRGGMRIKQIGEEAKQVLMNAFRKDLTLMLIANLKQKNRKRK